MSSRPPPVVKECRLPLPTEAEWLTFHIYDPPPGIVHITDLINAAMDGVSARDMPSDYIIGTLIYAAASFIIPRWTATLFHRPFSRDMKLRPQYERFHFGNPFLGPDGKVLELNGRWLTGNGRHLHQNSNLTLDTISQHPNYDAWFDRTFYINRGADYWTYLRVTEYRTQYECTMKLSRTPYTPGPIYTYPQDSEHRLTAPSGGMTSAMGGLASSASMSEGAKGSTGRSAGSASSSKKIIRARSRSSRSRSPPRNIPALATTRRSTRSSTSPLKDMSSLVISENVIPEKTNRRKGK